MTEGRSSPQTDPQTQIAGPPEGGDPTAAVVTGLSEPTPGELNEQLTDGHGPAVSAQPTHEAPVDLRDARERAEWDSDTDDAAGQDQAERGQ